MCGCPACCSRRSRMAPPGGRLTGFRASGDQRVPGVRHVAARDGWIAVVADNWWAAERRSRPPIRAFPAARLTADLRAAVRRGAGQRRRADSSFGRGDYDKAVRGSRPLAATYYAAPSQHLGLEPLTATARVRGDRLEVWAPTQAPGLARSARRGVDRSIRCRWASRRAARWKPMRSRSRSSWRERSRRPVQVMLVAKREPEPRPRSRRARWRE